ncbi:MAG TPA: hypothetical protein VLR45_01900 [Desulfoprunum sp.]|nr:hypothetical protein [Desulfoprunum sp.]
MKPMYRHLAAMGLDQTHGLLEGVLVIGVHDRLDPFPGQGIGHRVKAHIFGIRDLLDTYDNLH